jgi:hypothetical protein
MEKSTHPTTMNIVEDECMMNDEKEIFTYDLVFPELENTPISLKPYMYFCMMYCFNAIFILPYFVALMIVTMPKAIIEHLKVCEMMQVRPLLIN